MHFHEAFAALCTADQSDLATNYSNYLSAKKNYEAAVYKLRDATDVASRTRAMFEMQVAEQEWSGRGRRVEIDTLIDKISRVHYGCAQ